jgi:hypothetical protein
MDVGFGQGLVDASLVGSEGAAALQEQRYAIERQTPVDGREVWSRLKVHGSCARDLWLLKPAFCPERVTAGLVT